MKNVRAQKMRHSILSILLFIFLVFAACGANIFSTGQEIEMGAEFAREIESQTKILENREWNDYINDIGRRIVSVCDRPNIEYHFKIVDDSTTINAFALPGGYIYVYSGLLLRADNEAEVAGVLAHEVGHVVGKHCVKRLTKIYGYQFIVALALGNNPSQLEQIAADILGGVGILYYGRDNEYEADAYSVKYMNALCYDPNAMVTFFEKLDELQTKDPSYIEKLMSTHPQPAERIEKIQEKIALLPPQDGLILNSVEYKQRLKRLYIK